MQLQPEAFVLKYQTKNHVTHEELWDDMQKIVVRAKTGFWSDRRPMHAAEFLRSALWRIVNRFVMKLVPSTWLPWLGTAHRHGRHQQQSEAPKPDASQQQSAAPKPDAYKFKAEGDPMIVIYDMEGKAIARHHYYGPAVILFFDANGSLQHIDFVGVCDRDGKNRQSPNADYVGEQARLCVHTGGWKYRDGCGKQIAEVSDHTWASEKPLAWQPPAEWLKPFEGGKTFILHAFMPQILEGPTFSNLWGMATAPEPYCLDFDRSRVNTWVTAMLLVAGATKAKIGATSEVEELLRYAVMYGMAATNSPVLSRL